MGRDEHTKNHRGRNRLAQTPDYAKTDTKEVEFSEEFADSEDKEAQARRRAAENRVKRRD